jgi:hypothetical protein
VVLLAGAGESALDHVVAAGERLEVVAGGGDVFGRLDIEGTTDVGKLGQRDPGGQVLGL